MGRLKILQKVCGHPAEGSLVHLVSHRMMMAPLNFFLPSDQYLIHQSICHRPVALESQLFTTCCVRGWSAVRMWALAGLHLGLADRCRSGIWEFCGVLQHTYLSPLSILSYLSILHYPHGPHCSAFLSWRCTQPYALQAEKAKTANSS